MCDEPFVETDEVRVNIDLEGGQEWDSGGKLESLSG